MPNVILESPSNIRAAYHPYPTPPPSNQLHASNCTQPNMPVFIFWIAHLSSQNTEIYMYSLKIPIPHPFFRGSLSNPLLTATQYFLPCITPHKPLFDFYYNQLQHLSFFFYFSYVGQSISNANSLISATCLNINYPNFHLRWKNYIVIIYLINFMI